MRYKHDIEDVADLFKSGFRADLNSGGGTARWVGLEHEYLLVLSDGTIMNPEVLDCLWRDLEDVGWQPNRDLISGKVVGVTKPHPQLASIKRHSFDVITTDFGYSTLEISFAPVQSLREAQISHCQLVTLITSILSKYDTYMLGYGVQPIAAPKWDYLGFKSRYELIHHVRTVEETPRSAFHCISAASQTQVEVSASEAIPVVNALNATSGLRIALCANSSVWQNRVSPYKAIRHLFWDWTWPNRKQQWGIPSRFRDIEHYIDYLLDFRSIGVTRENISYRLNNNMAFRSFFLKDEGEVGRAPDGHTMRIFGDIIDIHSQSGFAWFDTRLQPKYGTVEDRVSCQQPPSAALCSAALTLGLVENYSELIRIAGMLSIDQWRDIRVLACTHGLDFSYPGLDVKDLIKQMLHIAEQGLQMRGFGEETYLEPLYQRLAQGRCPADDVREQFLEGGVAKIIALTDMRGCG